MKSYRQSRPRSSFKTYEKAEPFTVGQSITTPYGFEGTVELSTEYTTRVKLKDGSVQAYDTSQLRK